MFGNPDIERNQVILYSSPRTKSEGKTGKTILRIKKERQDQN